MSKAVWCCSVSGWSSTYVPYVCVGSSPAAPLPVQLPACDLVKHWRMAQALGPLSPCWRPGGSSSAPVKAADAPGRWTCAVQMQLYNSSILGGVQDEPYLWISVCENGVIYRVIRGSCTLSFGHRKIQHSFQTFSKKISNLYNYYFF